MADINLSTVVGGASGLPQLAPDLTYPSTLSGSSGFVTVAGIDGSSGLTTALSLSGKFAIDLLYFAGLALESMTFKLTVDGVVIWNSSFSVSGTSLSLFGAFNSAANSTTSSMQCKNSLLLEIQTTSDTSVTLRYVARPIL